MGPKKAKGKATIVGGYSVEEMTEGELRDYAQKLQDSLLQTQKELEHFQSEKAGIELAWESSRRRLATKEKLLRTKTEELEDFQVTSTKLLDETDQKLDYVEREDLQTMFDEVAKHNLDQLQSEKENLRLEREASKRVLQKEDERLHIEGAYEKLLQDVRQTRCEEVSQLIQYHEWKLNRTSFKYEDIYEELWTAINKQRLVQFKEAEKSRNKKIQEVDQGRTEEFQKIRNYFTRISFDCLVLIGDLKRELEDKMKRTTEQKILLNQTASKNKKLQEQKEAVKEVQVVLETYPKDKKEFAKNREIMLGYMQNIKDLELTKHTITARLEKAKRQKEYLELQFLSAIKKLQQSTTLKSVYLETQLKALTNLLNEKKKSQLRMEAGSEDIAEIPPKIRQATKFNQAKPSTQRINVVNLVFRDSMIRFDPPHAPEN